jgi:molybdate transport system substrate-binding protein
MSDLHVTAAGAYEHVLNALIPVFSREANCAIHLTVANAAGVIQRIEAREAADAVFSSAAGIAQLVAAGLADAKTETEIGRVGLGIAVATGLPLPDLSNGPAVRDALMSAKRVAFIDPKGGGTSGPFIAKLFEGLGIAERITANGVMCKTGRDVVRAVASGEATLGLTQATELIGATGMQFAGYLPDDVQVVTVYAGAVTADARESDVAARFIQFLKGPVGAAQFQSAGWL